MHKQGLSGYLPAPEATTQTLGPFTIQSTLPTQRGELFLAEGPSGVRVVVRTLPKRDHEALDAALLSLRFDHPNLARIVDAGTSGGAHWVAREDVPDPWTEEVPWPELRDRVQAILAILTVLDGVGMPHGRVHVGNMRLRDGVAVLVDPLGQGSARDDLMALGCALGPRRDDAPQGYAEWLVELAAGRWDRAIDAATALKAVDPRERPQTSSRPHIGRGLLALRRPPLRGRDAERKLLEAAVEQGREACTVVMVSGAPGMGSTRLVHAVASKAHRRGQSTAFEARRLADLVRPGKDDDLRALLLQSKGPPAARYARLRRLLVDSAGARLPVVVLDDAHLHREHLTFAHAWLARRAPGALLIDIDARAIATDPLLAKGVRALEEGGAQHIVLGPVAEEQLEAALLHLVPDEPELVRMAAAIGEGSPLDAHLALLTLLRTGEVPLDHSPWLSWLDVVLESPDDRALLEVAAALEDPLDPSEWTAAGSRLGLRWSKDLPRLLRLNGIGKRSLGRWRLAHASLRDALIGTCREGGRWEAVQRACAAVVRGPHSAMRRGGHLFEAGDRDASAAALASALNAEDADILEQVVTLLERTLADVPPDDPRRVQAGLARLRISQGERALEVGRQVARYGTTEDRFQVAVYMVGELVHGSAEEQDTWVARSFALARKLGRPEATGMAWYGQARVRLSRGDLAGAERSLAKASSLVSDPAVQVFHAELLTALGRPEEAGPILGAVAPTSDRVSARVQTAWGHRAFSEDQLPRALLFYRAAEELAERAGVPSPDAMWHVGKVLFCLGRVDEAAERFSLVTHEEGGIAVAGHVGALAVAARRGEEQAAAVALEWLDDHAEPVVDPGVARLLQDAAAQSPTLSGRIQSVLARCAVPS